MAIYIKTATGKEYECEAVTAGTLYPVLHIHTNALTGAEAYTVFSDPNETSVLEEIKDVVIVETDENGEEQKVEAQRHRYYEGFTQLYSVGPSPLIPGCLLVWLTRPAVPTTYTESEAE